MGCLQCNATAGCSTRGSQAERRPHLHRPRQADAEVSHRVLHPLQLQPPTGLEERQAVHEGLQVCCPLHHLPRAPAGCREGGTRRQGVGLAGSQCRHDATWGCPNARKFLRCTAVAPAAHQNSRPHLESRKTWSGSSASDTRCSDTSLPAARADGRSSAPRSCSATLEASLPTHMEA